MTCAPLAIGAVAVLVLAGCTGGSMPAETLAATSAPTGAPEATAFAPEDAAEVECIDVASRAAQAHGERTFVDAGTDYRSTFGANVAGNIREQCAILRERQQTGVIVAHGQGLLLLALAGLAALITTPRQRAAARATSAE